MGGACTCSVPGHDHAGDDGDLRRREVLDVVGDRMDVVVAGRQPRAAPALGVGDRARRAARPRAAPGRDVRPGRRCRSRTASRGRARSWPSVPPQRHPRRSYPGDSRQPPAERSAARRRPRAGQVGEGLTRRTPRRPAHAEVGDLAGDELRVEGQAGGHQLAARALGQPDEGVGQGAAVAGVDVGGDQRLDGLGDGLLDLAHGLGELLVPPRPAAEQQQEGVAVVVDPAEVGAEAGSVCAAPSAAPAVALAMASSSSRPTSSRSAR